jgi:putative component of membrane protein insertase Oxa1/YidC/SpoIIIJ protein YidD
LLILETSTLFLTLPLQHLLSLIQDWTSHLQVTTFKRRPTLVLTSSRRCPFQKKASSYATSSLTEDKPCAGSLSSILRVPRENPLVAKGYRLFHTDSNEAPDSPIQFKGRILNSHSGSPSAIQRLSDTNFLLHRKIYSASPLGLLPGPKAIEVSYTSCTTLLVAVHALSHGFTGSILCCMWRQAIGVQQLQTPVRTANRPEPCRSQSELFWVLGKDLGTMPSAIEGVETTLACELPTIPIFLQTQQGRSTDRLQDESRRAKTSQHSDIARAAMSNRINSTMPNRDDDNITNITEKSFALPQPAISHDSLLAPPISSLGRALQSVRMGSQGQDAMGHTLSDTPLGSAPSTAPGSPRL